MSRGWGGVCLLPPRSPPSAGGRNGAPPLLGTQGPARGGLWRAVQLVTRVGSPRVAEAAGRGGCGPAKGLRWRRRSSVKVCWHLYAGEQGARRSRGSASRAQSLNERRDPSSTPEEEPSGPHALRLILSRREKVRAPSKLPERLACLDFFSPKSDKYLSWRELRESWGGVGQMPIGALSRMSPVFLHFRERSGAGLTPFPASPPSSRAGPQGVDCHLGRTQARELQDSRCRPLSACLQMGRRRPAAGKGSGPSAPLLVGLGATQRKEQGIGDLGVRVPGPHPLLTGGQYLPLCSQESIWKGGPCATLDRDGCRSRGDPPEACNKNVLISLELLPHEPHGKSPEI